MPLGHNNVNCLHLHIVDLEVTGPTFHFLDYKNCPLEAVLKVLAEEAAASAPNATQTMLKAVEAANAAATVARAAADEALRASVVLDVEPDGRQDVEGCLPEIIELNVGGELVLCLPKETLMIAPSGSLLRSIVDRGDRDDTIAAYDAEGRFFLDLPARPFKRIIDHLRMIHLVPKDKMVQPPILEKQDEQEFWVLADLLGVKTFLMATHAGLQKLPGSDGPLAPPRSDSQDIRNGCTLS